MPEVDLQISADLGYQDMMTQSVAYLTFQQAAEVYLIRNF